MSQPVDLAALRAVLEKMTPEPWWFDFNWRGEQGPFPGIEASDYPHHFICTTRKNAPAGVENMEGVAALRNAAPALLTELEQLRRECDQAKWEADGLLESASERQRKLEVAEAELEQLRAQVATLTQERDSWQQAAREPGAGPDDPGA